MRRVLWVVDVIISQNGHGEGWTPDAINPDGWATSAIKYEFMFKAISLNFSNSIYLG